MPALAIGVLHSTGEVKAWPWELAEALLKAVAPVAFNFHRQWRQTMPEQIRTVSNRTFSEEEARTATVATLHATLIAIGDNKREISRSYRSSSHPWEALGKTRIQTPTFFSLDTESEAR